MKFLVKVECQIIEKRNLIQSVFQKKLEQLINGYI
jgi:hypothetical protein